MLWLDEMLRSSRSIRRIRAVTSGGVCRGSSTVYTYWLARATVKQRVQPTFRATAAFSGVTRRASRLMRLICRATAMV
jgi:hypothetical protein